MIDSYDIERLDEVKEQFQLMIKNLTHILFYNEEILTKLDEEVREKDF